SGSSKRSPILISTSASGEDNECDIDLRGKFNTIAPNKERETRPIYPVHPHSNHWGRNNPPGSMNNQIRPKMLTKAKPIFRKFVDKRRLKNRAIFIYTLRVDYASSLQLPVNSMIAGS